MIEIYDDLLPKKLIDEILFITTSSSFPWYKASNSFYAVSEKTAEKYKNNSFVVNTPQLAHQFFSENGNPSNSIWQDIPVVLVENFFKFYNLKSVEILRAKANLMLKTNIDTKYHNPPHIDTAQSHDVLLYYVNDSDGDTIIFDSYLGNKIVKKISPKKGRFLYFSGEQYHASSPPVEHDSRIVVNINLSKIN